jgi:hypothetical protein
MPKHVRKSQAEGFRTHAIWDPADAERLFGAPAAQAEGSRIHAIWDPADAERLFGAPAGEVVAR